MLTFYFNRFADFVEGSPHLMSNEVSVHAQEYGFGGMIFEDTDDEDEEEDANNFTDDDDTNLPERAERDFAAGDGCRNSSLRPAAWKQPLAPLVQTSRAPVSEIQGPITVVEGTAAAK